MKIMLITMALSSQFGFAQTPEIEAAKRRYQDQELITQTALQRYNLDKREQDRQENALRQIQQNIQNTQSMIHRAERELTDHHSRITQYQRDIPRLEQEMNRINSEKNQLLSERSRLDQEHSDLIRRNDDLTRRIQSLNSQLDQARQNNDTQAEQRILAERRPLLDERDRVQSQIPSLVAQLRSNRSQLDQANQRLTRVQSEHQQAHAEIQRLNAAISTAQRSIGQWQLDLNSLKRDESQAESRLRDLRFATQSSAAVYQREYQLAQSLYQEYQRLLREYEDQKAAIEQTARLQAEADAGKEAEEKAESEARILADRDAKKAASDKATADVGPRDLSLGFEEGLSDQGRSPDLNTTYEQGVLRGQDLAQAKAHREIRPSAFNNALEQLKNSEPSLQRTIVAEDLDEEFDGGSQVDLSSKAQSVEVIAAPSIQKPTAPDLRAPQTRVAPSSSMRHEKVYYRPQCSHLQNELARLCLNAYEQGYNQGFITSYSQSFKEKYIRLFNRSAQEYYQFLLDTISSPDDLSKGRIDGARAGGLKDGYQAAIATLEHQARIDAQREFKNEQQSSFLVKVHGLRLIDSNGDGLMSSGETVRFQLTLDNLGGSSPEYGILVFKLKNSQSLEEISHTHRNLPELSGNTRTVLEGLFTAKISQGTHNLSDLKVDVELIRDDTKEILASLRYAEPIRFPVELYNAFGRLQVQNYTEVLLSFRNNLNIHSKPMSFTVQDTQDLIELGESVELPALEPNGTTTVAASIRLKRNPSLGSKLTMIVHYENGMEQYVDTDMLLPRDGRIRLLNSGRQELSQDTLKVRSNQEFQILGNMEYLSQLPQIGPMSLRVSQRSRGVRVPNNGTVGVNWGNVSRNQNITPTTFRFIATPQPNSQESITFQLLKGSEIIDTRTVVLEF